MPSVATCFWATAAGARAPRTMPAMPSYPWTCGACAASNAPDHAVCATCACPASSTRQQRLAYLAAHEGRGPAVIAAVPAPAPRQRRPALPPGTAWLRAAAVLALAAVVAFVLLWGGGPVLGPMGGSAGGTAHWIWTLPDWASLASLTTVILAPLATVACLVVGVVRRRSLSMAAALGWGSLALIVLLLTCCR